MEKTTKIVLDKEDIKEALAEWLSIGEHNFFCVNPDDIVLTATSATYEGDVHT